MTIRSSVLLLLTLSLAGCDPSGGEDAGGADAGPRRDAAPLDAGAGAAFEPFALLADPHLPARALPGRMRLASSREPEPADGFGNGDHNHFVRVDGDRHVLLEAEGPGVLTRLWFTGREPATQDYSVIDRTVLHVEIDGAEVEWPGVGSAITLGELTSGGVPGFPRPWVGDRAATSNGLVVNLPLAFRDSAVLWIEPLPGVDTLFYYQIDWRALPPGTEIRSFDGTLTAAEQAALEAATDLWVRDAVSPVARAERSATLEPGASVTVELAEPTVVRALEAQIDDGARSDLEITLTVDGREIVTTPLERFFYFAPPTEPHASALTTVGPDRLSFRYPFPVSTDASLRLHNAGSAPVTGAFAMLHDPGTPPRHLGAIRIRCGVDQSPPVGENIALLELSGRRGHYAGQFLVTRAGVDGFWAGFWMLEGDHELFVDDETILGTGLEDYRSPARPG